MWPSTKVAPSFVVMLSSISSSPRHLNDCCRGYFWRIFRCLNFKIQPCFEVVKIGRNRHTKHCIAGHFTSLDRIDPDVTINTCFDTSENIGKLVKYQLSKCSFRSGGIWGELLRDKRFKWNTAKRNRWSRPTFKDFGRPDCEISNKRHRGTTRLRHYSTAATDWCSRYLARYTYNISSHWRSDTTAATA